MPAIRFHDQEHANVARLQAAVGDAQTRVVRTALGRDATDELRDELAGRLGSAGIEADTLIEGTTDGLVVHVVTPTPDLVTDDVLGDVPDGAVQVVEGDVMTEDQLAGPPGSRGRVASVCCTDQDPGDAWRLLISAVHSRVRWRPRRRCRPSWCRRPFRGAS